MKFSINKAAAATVVVMLGAASPAWALTNPTLLYSFENPPGDPNGPLDGFVANTGNPGDTTLSQSTIGATNGSNSLLFAQNASATFTAFQNPIVPAAFNDPATAAISFDVTVPAGGQFGGTFANIAISEFAIDNDQSSNGTGPDPFNFQLQATQQNVSFSVGTHRVVLFLDYAFNPNTIDFGPNGAGVSLSSMMGSGPEQFTPTSFEFYVNKGGTVNAPLNLYVDNIQAITASGWNALEQSPAQSGGDWNNGNNWWGPIPNAIDADAEFIDPVNAATNETVTTAVPVTIGTLHFNNFNAYTITGAGSLTLQTSAGLATVVVDQPAAETINVPLTIASNTTLNVPTGGVLTISSPVTVNANKSLTPTGTGLVTYSSNITLLSGASITFGNTTQANVLSLTTGSLATVMPHGANPKILLGVAGLSFGGNSNNWLGKVDITNNDMIVHGGDITKITNQIKSGFASGTWGGTTGISSSIAHADTRFLTAVGYSTGGNPLDGVNTVATDVLVKYTYYGDTDLNGTVNGADYHQVDLGFGGHMTGWQNGDFNYDGVVNGTDYALIDNTFNQIAATGAGALAIVDSSSLIASPQSSAAVPEPTMLGLMGIAAMGLVRTRRRRGI